MKANQSIRQFIQTIKYAVVYLIAGLLAALFQLEDPQIVALSTLVICAAGEIVSKLKEV